MGFGDAIFLQLAGNDRLDLMFQAESGEGHCLGGDGGVDLIAVGGEEAGQFIVERVALVAIGGEEAANIHMSEGGVLHS